MGWCIIVLQQEVVAIHSSCMWEANGFKKTSVRPLVDVSLKDDKIRFTVMVYSCPYVYRTATVGNLMLQTVVIEPFPT